MANHKSAEKRARQTIKKKEIDFIELDLRTSQKPLEKLLQIMTKTQLTKLLKSQIKASTLW